MGMRMMFHRLTKCWNCFITLMITGTFLNIIWLYLLCSRQQIRHLISLLKWLWRMRIGYNDFKMTVCSSAIHVPDKTRLHHVCHMSCIMMYPVSCTPRLSARGEYKSSEKDVFYFPRDWRKFTYFVVRILENPNTLLYFSFHVQTYTRTYVRTHTYITYVHNT